MSISKYSAFIFDFDGVIVDSVDVKTEAFELIYAPYGREVQDKVKAHHLANGGISRFEKFKFYHKNFLDLNISEAQVDELANRFSEIVMEKVVNAPYLFNSLEFIKNNFERNLPQFICTGTPENEILEICAKRNISQYFKGICGSPLGKTELLKNILDTYGYQNSEVVFFGDSINDYQAAINNNIDFFGCNNHSLKDISLEYFDDFLSL